MDELILKCLQGEGTSGENEQVWEWLKSSSENFRHYEQMRDVWIASGMVRNLSESEIDRRFERVRNRIGAGKKGKKSFYTVVPIRQLPEWLKYAAVFIFAFLLGAVLLELYYGTSKSANQSPQYVVEAPFGAKINMSLADGTKVWLNAGSRLTYSDAYNEKSRRVSLSGEGYFEVAKNRRMPFYVEADGVEIKAIGTAFNVKAYPDEDLVETTLVEGKVAVSQGRKEYVLDPKQQISLYRNHDAGNISDEILKNINTNLHTSWRGKRWIFAGESMGDFARKLERRYDVHITISDSRLADYKLTGSIEQQTLDQLLNALRLTVPLSYRITDRDVLLSLDERLKKDYELLMKK
ncbi:FecR family protein [Gaoshiqia sediminis]|uniref:DUF4974 domain-containing protein n=1 Tax=Gaoshiqia sediminis TaxID=2986998 RepID=A0AA42CAZ0_9BACT|nr:FecR domain-containing protein [Gaoshiqia sediminis]MCW0484220.1 DUF4974 domain-containing protein [Gaoshiqia sediminis]